MRRIVLGFVGAVLGCALVVGCGSSSQTETKSATGDQTQTENVQADVNCDEFMQQLADGCFAVTAFEEDNVTPLHIFDEAGNDLGEVDQRWAAGYCECYAQLAFQTFGCLTVIEHENLDDEAYAKAYEPIVSACIEPPAPPEHHHHQDADSEDSAEEN